MSRSIILALTLSGAGCATFCTPRITEGQAIILAKNALDADAGEKVSSEYPRYMARLEGCRWTVVAHSPPQSLSGDAKVLVAAETGMAQVLPRMRTDPRKVERMLRERE